jgi:hypothetical protein
VKPRLREKRRNECERRMGDMLRRGEIKNLVPLARSWCFYCSPGDRAVSNSFAAKLR